MVRIGLIGLGGMGYIHYQAYKAIPDAKVVAVVDPRTDLARERIADDSVAIYATAEEMYSVGGFDMVDICTPSFTHTEFSIQALRHGYHVLSEKPMALSHSDAKRILEAKEESGKLYMVAHVVRFMSPYKYLTRVVRSGELGAPKLLEFKRFSEAPKWSGGNWMMDKSKSGGVALELCIHDIDYVQYLFGAPRHTSSVYRVGEDHNDYLAADLTYDGFAVRVTGGWFDTPIDFRAEFTAIFERGYVDYIGGVLKRSGEVIDLGIKEEDTGINLTSTDGYAEELEYFVNCVAGGNEPSEVTPQSSYDSIALADYLTASTVIIE